MLLNTFSPMMAGKGCVFSGTEISFNEVKKAITIKYPWKPNPTGFPLHLCEKHAVGHEVTAHVLSVALEALVSYEGRKNVSLGHKRHAYVITPNFRPAEGSREFSREEVEGAGFRCFFIRIYDPSQPRYKVYGQAADVGGSMIDLCEFHSLEDARKQCDDANSDWNIEQAWIYDHWAPTPNGEVE